MPVAPATIPNDPLEQCLHSNGMMPSPLPLLTTSYDVAIRGGLTAVTERRTFRNAEEASIEATITFPVPVHAVVYGLELQIGERRLQAECRKREQAREDYEEAIDAGKTAVLHEEVLRGVHMLSVGHLPPGDTVVVTTRWAVSLSWVAGRAQLRIPVTVGDVYGQSPLSDADDLISGGAMLHGTLAVMCESGRAFVGQAEASPEPCDIALDRPIDIVVRDWQPEVLQARASDGRRLRLDIAPAPVADAAINAAIMVDRSGSMSSVTGVQHAGRHDVQSSKFRAVCNGLKVAADDLPEETVIDLWQFDNQHQLLGTAQSKTSFVELVDEIAQPGGGTEIGAAITQAAITSGKPDILVITDGKSYALDVQRLAATGCRISVVLVGEDSLEANIGHLAAVTGGELFIALDQNVGAVIASALQALRRPRQEAVRSKSNKVLQYRSGMTASAVWRSDAETATQSSQADTEAGFGHAATAFAASLAIAKLGAPEAAALAEREGILCHLTSLIVVDEEGVRQQGLPATRKIALPAPAAAAFACGAASPTMSSRARTVPSGGVQQKFGAGRQKSVVVEKKRRNRTPGKPARNALFYDAENADIATPQSPPLRAESGAIEPVLWLALLRNLVRNESRIAWGHEPDKILAGDLAFLPTDIAEAVRKAAGRDEIKGLAAQLGLTPQMMLIGVLAHACGDGDRQAQRIARRIFGSLGPDAASTLNTALTAAGFSVFSLSDGADAVAAQR